jgi:hypothetical protein
VFLFSNLKIHQRNKKTYNEKPPLTPPRPPLTPPKEGNKKMPPREGNKNTPPREANNSPPNEGNNSPSFGGVRCGLLQVSEKVYYKIAGLKSVKACFPICKQAAVKVNEI